MQPQRQPCDGVEQRSLPPALYRQLLKESWNLLHADVQAFHGCTSERKGEGLFNVRRGHSFAAFVAGWLGRLPKADNAFPTKVIVRCKNRPGREQFLYEIWERTFGTRKLTSTQWAEGDRLLERFGHLLLCFSLEEKDSALIFQPQRAYLVFGSLRVALPRALSPQVWGKVSGLSGSGRGLAVSVRVELALGGLLLAYEGNLQPEETS